jgi:DUF4097 and DUF4098 domain-containing protein YvlB
VSGRKIGLLLLILGFGAAIETTWSVRNNFNIGPEGCRVLGGRFYGPSYVFTEESHKPVPAGARVEVVNAFGAVVVTAGEPGELRSSLRKVVFLSTEEQAREFAGRVNLRAEVQGDVVRVSTNRDEVGRDDRVGLETHLDLRVPPGTAVVVRNEHGRVEVRDVARAEISSSYDGVQVEHVTGAVDLKSRHGAVAVSDVGGDLVLRAQYGDVEVARVKGKAALDAQHGQVSAKRTGGLKLEHAYGDVHIEGVEGDLEVKAEHAGIEATEVSGNATIQTSYDGVQLARVGGNVRVRNQHGEVKVTDVKGGLVADASYQQVELENVEGLAEVTVSHGGLRARGLAKGARVKVSGDDVNLDGFAGAVDVQAERASVHLSPRGPVTESILVRTTQGGIRLEVPAGSRFDLDARAKRGEVRADIPGLLLSRPDARSVTGKMAGGGNAVSLTADGDVELESRSESARGEM